MVYLLVVGTTPGWATAARLAPASGAELVSALCGVAVELSAQVVVQVAGRAGNAKAEGNVTGQRLVRRTYKNLYFEK